MAGVAGVAGFLVVLTVLTVLVVLVVWAEDLNVGDSQASSVARTASSRHWAVGWQRGGAAAINECTTYPELQHMSVSADRMEVRENGPPPARTLLEARNGND